MNTPSVRMISKYYPLSVTLVPGSASVVADQKLLGWIMVDLVSDAIFDWCDYAALGVTKIERGRA